MVHLQEWRQWAQEIEKPPMGISPLLLQSYMERGLATLLMIEIPCCTSVQPASSAIPFPLPGTRCLTLLRLADFYSSLGWYLKCPYTPSPLLPTLSLCISHCLFKCLSSARLQDPRVPQPPAQFPCSWHRAEINKCLCNDAQNESINE